MVRVCAIVRSLMRNCSAQMGQGAGVRCLCRDSESGYQTTFV